MDVPDMWAQWRQQRAEQRQFAEAYDFAALRELTARWCLGELSWSGVGQPAPRDPETVEIGEALAAINRAGMLTSHSQPARTFEWGVQQRAFVEGYATPEVEEQIRRLIAGTRLQMAAQIDAQWFTSYKGAAPATRHRTADGEWRESRYGQFGARLSASAMDLEFPGIPAHIYNEIADMARITLWDPQWESSDLLFRRLSVPDWDNPPPLREEDRAMPDPPVPSDAERDRLMTAWKTSGTDDEEESSRLAMEALGEPPATVPTDAEVEAMEKAMEEAFTERDRLFEVWRAASPDQADAAETAMDAQDRHAAELLDQYTAAVRAQYAESDARRDINVVRHGRDQAVQQGDLTAALQGDDWLEDHGVHADERATCHQCQSWADHAHDQVTNRRITLEEWEGRTPDGWESTGGGSDNDTGPADMPPAAEPYQPPTKDDDEFRHYHWQPPADQTPVFYRNLAEYWRNRAEATSDEQAQREARENARRCYAAAEQAEPTEKAHLITDPEGRQFVSKSGAGPYQTEHAKAKGYQVEPVEGHSRTHGFQITKPTKGASGMANIDEVRLGIGLTTDRAAEGQGALNQGHAAVEEAQGMLMRATEGTQQGDASEALGLFAKALQEIDDAQKTVQAAIQAAEAVANRL